MTFYVFLAAVSVVGNSVSGIIETTLRSSLMHSLAGNAREMLRWASRQRWQKYGVELYRREQSNVFMTVDDDFSSETSSVLQCRHCGVEAFDQGGTFMEYLAARPDSCQ